MSKSSYLLASILIISLISLSYQDDADYFDFAIPRDDIDYVVYGNATTFVSYEFIEGYDVGNVEVGTLEAPPQNGEWLFEAITEDGVYYYVVNNQELFILGPNEFSFDATHDYAEARWVSVEEAAYDLSQFAPGVVGVIADQSGGFVGY